MISEIVRLTPYALALAVLASVLTLLFLYLRRRRRAFRNALSLVLLSVRLPQRRAPSERQEAQDPEREVALMGQFLNSLTRLTSPLVLEVAVHGTGDEIHFYIAAPRDAVPFVTRSIQGIWSEAEVLEAPEYSIFNAQGAAEGVYLRQKRSHLLPIKTFRELGVDTFAPLLNTFSKLHTTEEGMAIQVVLQAAHPSQAKRVSDALSALRSGKSLKDALGEEAGFFSSLFGSGKEKEKSGDAPAPIVVDERAVKALEQKISQPLFLANVRLIVSARDARRTEELLHPLMHSFAGFSGELRNEFSFVRMSPAQRFFSFIFRQFEFGQRTVLSSDEIASFFHFPVAGSATPNVRWLSFKEVAPPTNLPSAGAYLGESVFRGDRHPVYLSEDDRRRHLYIVGQTGTGKSNLLNLMIQDDIRSGKGVALIDPHGDLVESVLGTIPRSRYEDVVLFDPSDFERPVGLNMLEYDLARPEQKTFVVNELFNILSKLYDLKTTGGPMFELYLKNALLLLMEDAANEPSTLLELPRIFTDAEFRARKLARISNPTVIDFWEKEATKVTSDEHSLASMAPYITSKFNNFTANDYIRPIVSQPVSAFNFRTIMDEGKILLVNLSKGKIGEVNAGLMGMIVVGKILMAAFSRADATEESRRDFNLYIDEFQSFTTDSIATILSEARKYHLNLVIAHQFIAQLTEPIRDAVFGNVGSTVAFRVGAPDAEYLAKIFGSTLSVEDLTNIENLNAYVRLLIAGQTTPPFNIKTPFADRGNSELAARLRELARQVYGSDRAKVEADALRRLRS